MNLPINKKLDKNSYYLSYTITIIFLSSFIYALLVGYGIYGYGLDYYGAYIKGFDYSTSRVNTFNYLGFKMATLDFNDFFYGVYLVTFIITLSTGYLLRENLNYKQSHSVIFFLIIFFIAIHTWPIIMSTSNAMRQGLSMSFIFFALACSFRKKYLYMIFFLIFSIFMHKSGIFLFPIFLIAVFSAKLFSNLSHKERLIINFLIGSFLFILYYYLLDKFIFPDQQPTRIINRDFRGAFVLISLSYILISFFYKGILANIFNLSLYYYSFISFAPLVIGLNWQYERLGMMMLIPYIFSFGFIINKRSYQFYLITSFLLLLALTIYTGMYSALLKSNPLL